MTRSFLEVDDLDPARLRRVLDHALAWKADPAQVPAAARRPGRGRAVREAVGAHADLDRDGGRDARRPPDLHPRRGGRSRRARVGRGRRPHDGRHVRRRSRRGCSTTTRSSGWTRSSTSRSSTCSPIAAHPCQALADLLTLREHFVDSKAAGSRTSATATTSPRRSRSRPRSRASSSWSRRPRATSSTPTSSTAPAISAARSSSPAIRTTRSAAPTRSTPTCGRRWGRRTSASTGCTRSPAAPSTTR